MIKINLLGASNDGGGGSVLKPLEVTPLATEQEFIPDGFTGYSYVRVKGGAEAGLTEPLTVKSTNEVQEISPAEGKLGFDNITVEPITYDTLHCDSSTNAQVIMPQDSGNEYFNKVIVSPYTLDDFHIDITKDAVNKTYYPSGNGFRAVEIGNVVDPNLKPENIIKGIEIFGVQGSVAIEGIASETIPITVRAAETEQVFRAVDSSVAGYSVVTVEAAPLEDRTFEPSISKRILYPREGNYGIKSVTLNPVTSSIDENIVPENIVKGVTILGVEGTMEKLDLNYKLKPKYIPLEWIGNMNGQNIKYKFPFNDKYDHIKFTAEILNNEQGDVKHPGALMGYGISSNITDRNLSSYYTNLKKLGYEDSDDILAGIEFIEGSDSKLYVKGLESINYSFYSKYEDASVSANPDLKLWSYDKKQTYTVGYSKTKKKVEKPSQNEPIITTYYPDCVKIVNNDVLPEAKLQVFRFQKNYNTSAGILTQPPIFTEFYDCFVFFGNRCPVASPPYPGTNDSDSNTYIPVWDKGQYTFRNSSIMKLYSCKIYSYDSNVEKGEEGTLSETPYAEYRPYLVLNSEGVYEPTFINVLDNTLPEIHNIGPDTPTVGIDSLNAISGSNQAELQQVYDSISTL